MIKHKFEQVIYFKCRGQSVAEAERNLLMTVSKFKFYGGVSSSVRVRLIKKRSIYDYPQFMINCELNNERLTLL